MCRYTLELPHRENSNVNLQHMLLKIRKKTTVKPRLFEVPGTAGILSNNR